MRLVDSHCHLDDKQFAGDREAVIDRARAAGVEHHDGDRHRRRSAGSGAGIRLADRYPFFYATVGVHPHDASKATPETFDACAICCGIPRCWRWARSDSTTTTIFRRAKSQRAVFIRQLELAATPASPS